MKNAEYITIPQLAKILGISRIAVYKKVKNGQIEAVRMGRAYFISRALVATILGKTLKKEDKQEIDKAIKKVVKEYGEVLRLLGNE